MSRAELGRKVNLHESTVKRYEDGQIKALDIDKMKEFSKALDIDPTYLMGWDKKEKVRTIDLFAGHNGSSSNILSDMLSEKIIKLYKNLNEEGKQEALKRIEELTYIPKYSSNTDYVETIAAHNDYLKDSKELNKVKEDIEDMKNW